MGDEEFVGVGHCCGCGKWRKGGLFWAEKG